jgi:squalene cyclase
MLQGTQLVKTIAAALLIVVALLATTLGLSAAAGDVVYGADPAAIKQAIADGLTYLKGKQVPDGGIEGWTPGASDEYASIKTVFALAGAGESVEAFVSVSGTTPNDYLAGRTISYTHDLSGTIFPGRTGMLAAAAVAGDADPNDFGGMDLIAELTDAYNAATGAYSSTAKLGFASGAADAVNQAWAMLGLAAAQEAIPARAAAFLNTLQEADGGWGYGFGGDVDLTSIAVQALIASGVSPTSEPIVAGLGFLRDMQQASGGWASWGALSPDSTGGAIQALTAAGYAPLGASWMASDGSPMTDLLAMQAPDGSFANAVGTAHALAGLSETSLPILGTAGKIQRALTWLNAVQADDGSWSGFGGPDAGATSDAILAYVAAGYDPASISAGEGMPSAVDALAEGAAPFVQDSADKAGKLTLAVVAAGQDPRDFGGIDLVDAIEQHYSPTMGAFGSTGTYTNTWYQSYAILGLAAAKADVPAAAVSQLLALQQAEGGWKYDLGNGWWAVMDPESTGLALQALIAAGISPTDARIIKAVAYLRSAQDTSAGWGDNANATAVAMQGLLSTGEDLEQDWILNGNSPRNALASYQKIDGPFVWKWDNPWGGPADNGLATSQAVPALLGASLPLRPGATPAGFTPAFTGPDPDRLVAQTIVASLDGAKIWISLPFGGDLDLDGAAEFSWRAPGAADWTPIETTGRGSGVFTATLVLSDTLWYEFSATLSDADGIQHGQTDSKSLTMTELFKPKLSWAELCLHTGCTQRWWSTGPRRPIGVE